MVCIHSIVIVKQKYALVIYFIRTQTLTHILFYGKIRVQMFYVFNNTRTITTTIYKSSYLGSCRCFILNYSLDYNIH